MIEQIQKLLDDMFKKTTGFDFDKYMKRFYCTKWMLISDYCLDDRNKANDVITFSILPYYDSFENIKKVIDGIAPKDIKNTRHINKAFIDFLKSNLMFHISFLLGRNNQSLLKDWSKEVIVSGLEEIKTLLEEWKENTPGNIDYYNEVDKRVNIILSDMKSKGYNLKLIQRLLLTCFLAAYIGNKIFEKAESTEIIGWFSDRDALLTKHKNVASDLFHINFHGLTGNSDAIKIVIGKPNDDSKAMWYDELNKLPDYITGVIADWDMDKNTVTHEKFSEVLKDVVADNPNISILKLYKAQNGNWTCVRILPSNEDKNDGNC